MTNELLALIAAYFACSDMAETRQLTQDEVRTCNAIYLDVKLSFVPGVGTRHYPELSTRERAAVSMAGYLAFDSWRQDNPSTVHHLEQVARGEAKLEDAG